MILKSPPQPISGWKFKYFIKLSYIYMVSVVNESNNMLGSRWNLYDGFIEFREYYHWLFDMKCKTQQNNLIHWCIIKKKQNSRNPVTLDLLGHSSIVWTKVEKASTLNFISLLIMFNWLQNWTFFVNIYLKNVWPNSKQPHNIFHSETSVE